VGDPVDFAVDVDQRADCVVVRVTGELDMATADTFGDALNTAVVSSTPHVILDLSECSFVDSAGMRIVTATIKQAQRVSIVASEPAVLRVLEITAVDTMVSVHPTLDAAL
jgi:anti-sigma B factor antagonist